MQKHKDMNAKIVMLYAAGIILTFSSCSKKKTTEQMATPEIDVAEVVVDSVLISKTFPGTISSANSVDIVARVNGYLVSQNYEGGAHVKKGQVLFTIEDTQYRDAVEQAKAALANAKSAYEYATKNYAAMQKALESDAVAQIQVLEAKNNYEQAEASVKNAQAALQTAQTNLGYCTIRAPFDGTMTKGEFTPGSYIGGAGSPVKLGTIYDNENLFANFYIEDNSYIRAFTNENNRSMIDYKNVPIEFDEPLPHSYAGELVYMAPSVDTSTGTLLLRVQLNSPYGELRNGMYCTVKMPYKFEPKAVMVKDAAISTSQTNKYVYVVNDSNKVVFTPIEIGEMANDSMRIVNSGLTGNEKYVTKALLKVRPGMEVKPILTK